MSDKKLYYLINTKSKQILKKRIPWPRFDGGEIVGLSNDLAYFEIISRSEMPVEKDKRFTPIETVDYDNQQVILIWEAIDLTPEEIATRDRKTWMNVQAFMAQFTMEEKAGIGLSVNPMIAALRIELSSWHSAVYSDDPRVQQGLDALVADKILSEDRKAEILVKKN